MPSKKRERRIAATNLEYEEHVKSSAKEAVLAATKDEDLFVIDRTGSKNKRRQLVKNAVVVADKSKAVSKVEEHLIKKKVDSLARGELTLNQKRDKVLDEKKIHLMDMWGDDDIAPNSKKTTTNGKGKGKKNAMIAGPGFSYNPVDTAHQDTLAEALALEIKENERKVREQQGFAKPQIRGNNQGQDSEDEDDMSSDDSDSDDEEEVTEGGVVIKKKMKEKLTRAQRNKIKRRKLSEAEQRKAKRAVVMSNSIKALPVLMRQLEKEKKAQTAKQALIDVKKTQSNDDSAMTYGEASQVPLSDELGGSLRTVIPKGNAMTGIVSSFAENKNLNPKNDRKQRHHEKPHKSKQVKWVAKYKYVERGNTKSDKTDKKKNNKAKKANRTENGED